MSAAVVLLFGLATGGWLALRPLLRPAPWPDEPPDRRDDVARAVSSLRDLEFARAAGTIDAADEARLRARIEASPFADADRPGGPAPVRTFAVAAILAGEVWRVFLKVGEFHAAAPMVRTLYEDARKRSGG